MTKNRVSDSQNPEEPSPLLTSREAARMLNVVPSTITKMVQRGELSGFRVRRRTNIYRASVEEYIRRNEFGIASPEQAQKTDDGDGKDGMKKRPRKKK